MSADTFNDARFDSRDVPERVKPPCLMPDLNLRFHLSCVYCGAKG